MDIYSHANNYMYIYVCVCVCVWMCIHACAVVEEATENLEVLNYKLLLLQVLSF